MYDPVTTALIRAAPALEGLDLDGLPKLLTAAFADIVSARIRLRQAVASAISPEISETLAQLRRLAAAHESYVALLPERDNRVAAAFVAASAHQACLLGQPESNSGSRVDGAFLSPEICSTLLFLVAEANADAAEAAKRIVVDSESTNPVERALLLSIKDIAQGQLISILRRETPSVAGPETDVAERALQALQLMIFNGIKRLATQLRRRTDVELDETSSGSAFAIFNRVKELCVEPIDGVFEAGNRVFSLYPGPLHLANLLISVERDLLGTALTRVPAPGGVPEGGWWQIIRRMARQRPYLWRNHRQAVESGYLEQGISSAISFPTGGGKSTLAELKIATALLRDEKVVFLAPTHALVGQTTRALKKTFQNFGVFGDLDDDVTFSDIVLPEVTVTTPERCLMLLAMQPDAFVDLGLIVFDECHLLHPRDEDRSRRGLDAMLAILNMTQLAPAADLLLLSAMMKNTGEVGGWIKSLTGRECLILDLAWKPTRQVRGCVVYPAEQISALKAKLSQARREKPNQKSTPVAVKREMLASPFGLFSLLQTWSTTDRRDYALLPLLSSQQLLSTGASKGGSWYLTPNGNQTSAAIAASAAASSMKTLVFVQNTIFCESCVNDFPARFSARPVALTQEEANWRALAVEEMGGSEYCYLKLGDDGVLRTGAASHHALLLREERELHESLFKRRDGIDVLFATSTLAQGMNLPSEIVIISGDSRFDPSADRMKKLEAHELLNAAGRAGRAGEGGQGFVLLVPSKIIDFDDQKNEIGGHWVELQAIFEQADQCLVIDDPLQNVLDQIHAGISASGIPAYLLSKLPLSVPFSAEDPAATLLRRSFAAYRAKAAGNEQWVDTRIAAALAARHVIKLPDEEKWIENVASSVGLSVEVLQQITHLADSGMLNGTAAEIMAALLAWLNKQPLLLMDLVRPESLEGLFGDKYKKLPGDQARAEQALKAIALLLPLWMSGVPLFQLEAAFLGSSSNLGRCEYARHFVSRIVPELAFVAALPARLLTTRAKQAGPPPPLPAVLATLGSAVREGCDSPEALATRINCGRDVSRVAARRIYDKIKAHASVGSPTESFDETRQRMRGAEAVSEFFALSQP